MNIIVTMYPVDQGTEARLREIAGTDANMFIVTNSTSGSLFAFLMELRRKRCEHLYVYQAGQSSSPLLAMLIVISFFIGARHRFLIASKASSPAALSLLDLFISLAKLGASEIYALLSVPFAWFRFRKLLQTPRQGIDAAEFTPGNVIYVRSVLWLGLSAGGAITHTLGVIRAMLRREMDITVAGVKLPENDPDTGKIDTMEIAPTISYVIPRELNHLVYSRTMAKQAISQLRDKSGVVYHRNSLASIAGVEISRATRNPLVLEYNGSENWMASNWGGRLNFMKLVQMAEDVSLKHAHLIIAVSDVLRNQLIAKGVEPERVITVPNGCDPVRFDECVEKTDHLKDQLRREIDPTGEAKIFTFVGTFGPWHGADLFVHSALRVLKSSPSNSYKFLFIGDGGQRPFVESIVQASGFSDNFLFTGLIASDLIPQHLSVSDGLVVPSRNNRDGTEFFGSPTKLFEYMLSSRPIIATDAGQVPDVLSPSASLDESGKAVATGSDGACALMVEKDNVQELANAIRFIANNQSWGERTAANARRRALKHYTWDKNLTVTLAQLVECVERDKEKQTILINAFHAKSGGGVTYIKNILPLLTKDSRLDIHVCFQERQRHLFDGVLDEKKMHISTSTNSFWAQALTEQLRVPLLSRKLLAEVTFSPANFGPLFAPGSVILLRNAISVAFIESRLSKKVYWLMLFVMTLLSCHLSKRIISVSNYATRATIGAAASYLNRRLSIIAHGVGENFYPVSPDKRKSNELLVVSDIYVQKNILHLVRAMPLVLPRRPDAVLRVAGAFVDTGYTQSIIDTCNQFGIAEHVILEGHVDDERLLSLYHNCAVFVFPSTVETFGNPLVEAMACGCPIATSNTAAMPEVAGDAAEYFNPHDVEDMARVIIDLLENPDKREDLSKRAVERARMYSWEETARKTADVLIEAAQK